MIRNCNIAHTCTETLSYYHLFLIEKNTFLNDIQNILMFYFEENFNNVQKVKSKGCTKSFVILDAPNYKNIKCYY